MLFSRMALPYIPFRCKGFSLIEAAIVLGIVGLVLGGIWVAASTVSEKMRLNEAVTGILTLRENVRKLFVTQGWDLAIGDNEDITETSFTAGLVPAAWGERSWLGAYNQSFPYSEANIEIDLIREADGAFIDIGVVGISQKNCIRLTAEMAARAGAGNLRSINVNASSTVVNSPPFEVGSIDCPSDVTGVDFIFTR